MMARGARGALRDPAVARRNWLVCVGLLVAVVAAAFGAIVMEQPDVPAEARLPASKVLRIIGSSLPLVGRAVDVSDVDPWDRDRVLALRVPRVLLAIVVGAALAVAGAVMQSFFQNPMASPYILGVASGASLGAAVAFAAGSLFAFGTRGFALGLQGEFYAFCAGLVVGYIAYVLARSGTRMKAPIPLLIGIAACACANLLFRLGVRSPLVSLQSVLAFAGALGVTFLVYALARRGGRVNTTLLLLTGIAVGTFAGALAYMLMFLFTEQTIGQVLRWVMGTLMNRGWGELAVAGPVAVVGIAFVRFYARDLNVMLLGEDTAQHLGVHVGRTRLVLLVVSSLLTAVAVAAVGIIGFVGLVVPHVMRLVVGPDHRWLLPASVLGGALLVLGADALVRSLPHESVPLGVLTTLVGCPFFIVLLTRRQKTFI